VHQRKQISVLMKQNVPKFIDLFFNLPL
jgi:hypothetical protein